MVILQPLPTYSGCTTGEFSEIWCQTVMQWMRCLFVLPTPCMQESKEWQKFKKKKVMNSDGKPRTLYHSQNTAFRDGSLSHQKVEFGGRRKEHCRRAWLYHLHLSARDAWLPKSYQNRYCQWQDGPYWTAQLTKPISRFLWIAAKGSDSNSNYWVFLL